MERKTLLEIAKKVLLAVEITDSQEDYMNTKFILVITQIYLIVEL